MLNIDQLKYDYYKLKEQDFLKLISSCSIKNYNDFDGMYGYIEDDIIFHYRRGSLMVNYINIIDITLDESIIKKLFTNHFKYMNINHIFYS